MWSAHRLIPIQPCQRKKQLLHLTIEQRKHDNCNKMKLYHWANHIMENNNGLKNIGYS